MIMLSNILMNTYITSSISLFGQENNFLDVKYLIQTNAVLKIKRQVTAR